MKGLTHKLAATFTGATLLVGLVPFVLYFIGRISGAVPGEQEWRTKIGGNHGPWTFTVPGEIMLILLYFSGSGVFPILTLLVFAAIGVRSQRSRFFGIGLLLALIQFALAAAQLSVLGWVWD